MNNARCELIRDFFIFKQQKMDTIETSISYKSMVVPITIKNIPEPGNNGVVRVSIVFFDVSYTFGLCDWNDRNIEASVFEFNQYYKNSGATSESNMCLTAERKREIIRQSVCDVVRGMVGIWQHHGTKLLEYAVYHLAHFVDSYAYEDHVIFLACRAIIDCDFWASPDMAYNRITFSQL